jgi:hypothetical protein
MQVYGLVCQTKEGIWSEAQGIRGYVLCISQISCQKTKLATYP